MTATYIHIPFCEHICFYCDFNKVFLEGQPVDEYVEMLLREMQLTMAQTPDEKIETIYVGGGTPTTLNEKQLDRLLTGMKEILPFQMGNEFTFEANPGDLSVDKLKVLHDHGVNRLSMGVQSFNDDLLKKIGRIHKVKDVYQSIANARQVGFENISIDLIYRLPGQTEADFNNSLVKALELELPHYSTYSLILENKTIFYNLMRQGKLPLPTEDEEANMYQMAIDLMAEKGRKQYEISNYALPGYESQHNLIYWKNEKYYGFGAGAHGYLGGHRYQNNGPIQQYLEPLRENRLPILRTQQLSIEEKIEEEMFLGLRKLEGVSIQHFFDKFQVSVFEVYQEVIDSLVADGLLEVTLDKIRLTEKGKFLGNEVFQAFLLSSPK
ncbi:coproporphyrinogen III oxidase [Carnobacterium divergens]|uniref:Heme chaperone HemW n=1 Tax=Carnobacterium divergens TaxID=2748 RepID=A0AAW8R8B9_CARDV|nr:radical SAM family heme chaperone HemW [Carnobacterium divergens]MDT1957907.1 radical SAM family heme chaperone HemW [Carnobacterium divergens]MDT1973910.1 radical SAM family heme chaperone HemW [Carnobacterium divergens]MDT1995214.1 radical SAM family heme chaperone HemW [Carnobacterium divergens]MDT2010667.1 radical SAM family heme chaperone HemW [Carnobacterium divergens]TFI64110.1 coproporphyrinogen III oxidase [Carnobacterium divergens]